MTQQLSDYQEILKLEQRYQNLRNLMEAVLESSLDGIILVNEQGKIRAVNQAFKRLYGFDNCELLGMDIQNIQQSAPCCFGLAEDLQRFFTEIFLSDGPAIRRELRLVEPEPKTISFYSRPVVDRDGKTLGRISIHSDITRERKLQDEIQDLAEFSDNCPFPVMKCNSAGELLYMNRTFRALLDQIHLPQDQVMCLLPEGSASQIKEMLQNKSAPFDLKGEFKQRFFEFTLTPSKAKGEVFIIVNDLTEQKRAEKKILDYMRDLEAVNRESREAQTQLIQSEKMASLGLLVAGIAHEINTPIGSINSNNDILIRSVSKMRDFLNCDQCPAAVRENPGVVKIMGILEEINRNNRMACDRIMNIIRSLKNFARLDEAERKKVNIHDGLDSTLTLVHHQLKNRIQVVKQYGNLPEIECFPNQLNQVFMNILVNAEQAMPERGTLTVKTFGEDDFIKIVISDTGIGIPKENLAKIFDPGFTTKGVGVGTGLGLSICYKIIQDHRGRIEVDSELGKGTTFTITLPIQ